MSLDVLRYILYKIKTYRNEHKKDRINFPSSSIHWVGNGFRVHNFLPSVDGLEMERMSPFILLDYNIRRAGFVLPHVFIIRIFNPIFIHYY